MDKLLTMSKKELTRLEIIRWIEGQGLKQFGRQQHPKLCANGQ